MYNRLLDTFIAVVESNSFSKAAEHLYTTPTSVMNQINSLEKHLGMTLLVRTNQGIQTTAAGESIYNDSKKIIMMSKEMIIRAEESLHGEKINIRIGTSMLNPCGYLAEIWQEICGQADIFSMKIVPFIDKMNSMRYLDNLLNTEIDAIVTFCGSETWLRNLNFFKIGYCRMNCLVPVSDELSKKDIIDITDLYDRDILLRAPKDNHTLIAMYNDLTKYHPKIRLDIKNDDFIEMFYKAERTRMIAVSPEICKDMSLSMKSIPVKWEYVMPLGLMYSKTPTSGLIQFLEVLERKIGDDYPVIE